MAFNLRLVHVQVDDRFEEIAEKKFSKLNRFFKGEPDITLIIKKEKFEFIMEAKIQYRRSKIFMKVNSNNLNAGLEKLVDKLKIYLSKEHQKRRSKKNKTGKKFFSPVVSMSEPIEEELI